MSDAEVEGKFRPLAGKVLPGDRCDRLLEVLWKLEDLPAAARSSGSPLVPVDSHGHPSYSQRHSAGGRRRLRAGSAIPE